MKIKKIITGILGAGVVSGIAYLAYKVGEYEGRQNEKLRSQVDDLDDDVIQFYDEPDEFCLAPEKEMSESVTMPELETDFAPLDSISFRCVSPAQVESFLLLSIPRKHISVKSITEYFGMSKYKAYWLIEDFQRAGYIGKETGNHRYPLYLNYDNWHKIKANA